MRKFLASVTAVIFALNMASTAFAGTWQQGSAGWKYQEDNGSYATNGWQWIDGKCYYFDHGIMLSNTATPDGYQVNSDGAWVVNGIVQTQGTGQAAAETNRQYPLAGMLEQLGLNYSGELDILTQDIGNGGVPRYTRYGAVPFGLISSGKYLFINQCGDPEALSAFATILSGENVCKTINDRSLDPLEIIADSSNYISRDQAQALVNTIRDFLNSFDWKNSDDLTKAKKAAEFVEQATYCAGSDTDHHLERTLYGVLIDKQGDCMGFSTTYHLLTRLMGMDCLWIGRAELNHAWNYIKINGAWYRFDGASSAHNFDFTAMLKNDATIEMPIFYDQTALTALEFNQQLVDLPYVYNYNPDVIRKALQDAIGQ